MLNIEYSVITSDVIKSFDFMILSGSCILFDLLQHQGDQYVEEEINTESDTGMVNGQVEPPVLPDLGQVRDVTHEIAHNQALQNYLYAQ